MTDDTTDRRRPGGAARPRLRRPAALLGAAALVAAAITAVTVSTAAQAADTPRTGLGSNGQKLTVSASANLDPDDETLRVTGSGYDTSKAIYVALCKDNGDGKIPSPCIGGADESGTGNSSHWIVPKGDQYEGNLAIAWGEGGTFDVEIGIKAKDNGVDCTQVVCSVVTRVDHRNSGDRSQDVRVPVTFEGQDTGGGDDGGEGEDVPMRHGRLRRVRRVHGGRQGQRPPAAPGVQEAVCGFGQLRRLRGRRRARPARPRPGGRQEPRSHRPGPGHHRHARSPGRRTDRRPALR